MLLTGNFGDNWVSVLIFFASASVVVTLPVKQSEKKNVTAGEKITLTETIELHGDYSVVWCLKNGAQTETLITCDGEKVEGDPPKRFEGKLHLDPKSGSLTIGPLNVDDSGVYEVVVTNGNNDVHTQAYEVTVSESKTTTGSPNSAHYQRAHLTVVLAATVCVVLLL